MKACQKRGRKDTRGNEASYQELTSIAQRMLAKEPNVCNKE